VKPALVALLALAALVRASAGDGAWAPVAGGTGATKSKSLAASSGNVPTASVAGHAVTLDWSASQFADGAAIPAYVVKRYDAITNALQTTLVSCGGLVGATTCTESNVPTGTWKYSVTPAAGAWRGVEGAKSASVVVLI
jgi:hypothetical protein